MTIVKELRTKKRELRQSHHAEQALMEDQLHTHRRVYSDRQLLGYEAWQATRGDASDFHESSEIGRLAFAQDSGIFCNLDQN